MKQAGYILILTLVVVAVMTALVTSIVNRVILFSRVERLLVQKEQARLFALSGLEVARAQLGKIAEKKSSSEALSVLLPIVNRWQTFTFTAEHDGIEGSCQIYITSESGKLPIVALVSWPEKKLVKNKEFDGAKLLGLITQSSIIRDKLFSEHLVQFIQKRERPIDDLTELAAYKPFGMKQSDLFSEPEKVESLFDLFTQEQQQLSLQPLLFSPTVSKTLGLKMAPQLSKSEIDAFIEKIQTIPTPIDWKNSWDKLLAPWYGKTYNALPSEIRSLLSQEFETRTFSVVSYGKFGNVVVKLYGILSQKELTDPYCIKKVYWIL